MARKVGRRSKKVKGRKKVKARKAYVDEDGLSARRLACQLILEAPKKKHNASDIRRRVARKFPDAKGPERNGWWGRRLRGVNRGTEKGFDKPKRPIQIKGFEEPQKRGRKSKGKKKRKRVVSSTTRKKVVH